ncbi:murein biosynthesis integral membrane protein MurJ [Streptomyces tanashiensis]
MTRAGEENPEPDAFAHLYRDQQAPGQGSPPAPEPDPLPAPAPKKSSRASGLPKSSAVMAAGTLVSRLTSLRPQPGDHRCARRGPAR